MSEGSSVETDYDAAMHEMMGFGSFATRRPKESSKVSLLTESTTTASQSSQTQLLSNPAQHETQHPDYYSHSPNPQPNDGQTSPQTGQEAPSYSSASFSTTAKPHYAFSNPATNTFYTRAELNEWARGKRNARGDTVYFKPAFVSDDPWMYLRPKNGEPSR